jgi:DNA-directed RNA polymerase subunit RPC12/RpoP
MGFKCSILGHRFDETTVDRQRHEEGTEVVITITERETCSRCGESRVVSENKEVTTMETPADADAPAASAGDPTTDSSVGSAGGEGTTSATDTGATGTSDAPDASADDAEIIDADADEETDAQAAARSAAETTIPDAEADTPTTDAVADEDAVILDDSDGEATAGDATDADGRDPADDAGGTGAAHGGDGVAAQQTGDGVAAGGTAGEAAPSAGDGAWPEEEADVADHDRSAEWPEESDRPAPDASGGAMGDWPEETKRDPGADGTGAGGPTIEPTEGPTVTVPEGMFKCSACGFTTEVESSSLRAGDFCPECHSGTLVQHEDDAE